MKTFKQLLKEAEGNPNHAADGKFSSGSGDTDKNKSMDWKEHPEGKDVSKKLKSGAEVKVNRIGRDMKVFNKGSQIGMISNEGGKFQPGGPKAPTFDKLEDALEYVGKKAR